MSQNAAVKRKRMNKRRRKRIRMIKKLLVFTFVYAPRIMAITLPITIGTVVISLFLSNGHIHEAHAVSDITVIEIEEEADSFNMQDIAVGEETGFFDTQNQAPVDGTALPWNLTLVNYEHPIEEMPDIDLVHLKYEQSIDARCYPDLQEMMDDCRACGLDPKIWSSFRTHEKQQQLYKEKVQSLINKGYSQEDAKVEAARSVAPPGTSEHELGLAVDIASVNKANFRPDEPPTEVQKWRMENCWNYGFILRYPPDKTDITGIVFEPWHYRYVGREDAKKIHELGITLEEYVAR